MQACDVRGFLIACAAMTPRTWDYHNRVMGFLKEYEIVLICEYADGAVEGEKT